MSDFSTPGAVPGSAPSTPRPFDSWPTPQSTSAPTVPSTPGPLSPAAPYAPSADGYSVAPPWAASASVATTPIGLASGTPQAPLVPQSVATTDTKSSAPKRGLAVVVAALLLGAGAGAGAGYIAGDRGDGNSTSASSFASAPSGGIITTPRSVQEVLANVQPAVVSITTIGPRGPEGAGTGIILTADGEIVTNAHVIEDGLSFEVTLDGVKDPLTAELIGSEPDSDVALIKITAQSLADSGLGKLPVAELGDSDQIQVGDPVVAIGNALALAGGPSVTTGIVSAKNRSLRDAGVVLENLVQTDAAINPGNSGGPLVNANGQVIGMNTAVIQQAGNSSIAQNIGFAISANTFKPIVDDIRSGGGAVRPRAYLGVSAENNTANLARKYGFATETGAVVTAVESGSPADLAKLERLDVVVEFGGETVDDASDLVELVRDREPGENVSIKIERNGETQTLQVELGSRP